MILHNYLKSGILAIAAVLFVNASYGQNKSSIAQAKWLIGTWKNQSAKTLDIETWNKLNDSTYQGRSYSLAGTDTVSSEHIRIEQHAGKLYYIPTVKNQNNGKAVTFTLTSSTNNQLVFENPEHDFPQKIAYTQINKDSLLTEISGTRKGKFKAIPFPMKRVR